MYNSLFQTLKRPITTIVSPKCYFYCTYTANSTNIPLIYAISTDIAMYIVILYRLYAISTDIALLMSLICYFYLYCTANTTVMSLVCLFY